MYLDHVPKIAAAMRADYECFERGVMFAVLSARVQFYRMPEQCAELEAKGADAFCLFAWKYRAYVELRETGRPIWERMCATADPVEALQAVTGLYGLGLVKGAFVCQLMGFDIACLDARNVKRESLDRRAWRTDGRKVSRKKCARYVEHTLGRARELWDTWCSEVGPDYGMTAEGCSKMHLDLIVRSKRLMKLPPAEVQLRNEVPF
jgi:hypothetical protein